MQVRKARESRGWSQEHLAAAAGVSPRTVQRAEAGNRVSPENTLALCAALGLTPPDIEPPVTGPRPVFPHLARLGAALDAAMADYGEAPGWRRSDPSAGLAAALVRMGLPADAPGYEEGVRQVKARQRILARFEIPMIVVGLPLAIGFAGIPVAFTALLANFANTWPTVLAAAACWAALLVPFLKCVAMFEDYRQVIEPYDARDRASAGLMSSDLVPVDVAWTRGFLWVARLVGDDVGVVRIAEGSVTSVKVTRGTDGLHSARVYADDLRWTGYHEFTAFDLTRLRDVDVRWLEQRIGTKRGAVTWRAVEA